MICLGCMCSYKDCICHLMPEQDEELVCHFCGDIHFCLDERKVLMCVDCAEELGDEDATHCMRCGEEIGYYEECVCSLCEFDAE